MLLNYVFPSSHAFWWQQLGIEMKQLKGHFSCSVMGTIAPGTLSQRNTWSKIDDFCNFHNQLTLYLVVSPKSLFKQILIT